MKGSILKKIIILFLTLFISFFLLSYYFHKKTETEGVYRIAKLKDVEKIGRGGWDIIFTYSIDGKTFEGSDRLGNADAAYAKKNIGKKYIIKLNKINLINRFFFTYDLFLEKPVPENIKNEPKEGWKKTPDLEK